MFSADQLATLEAQAIELPSWAFGNSGTRFRVFTTPGTPRTAFEKIDDAATVHEYTKLAPSVALHIPWDRVDNFAELKDTQKAVGFPLARSTRTRFKTMSTSLAR